MIPLSKVAFELQRDGYFVEIPSNCKDNRFDIDYHNILSVFNLIAVKDSIARLMYVFDTGGKNRLSELRDKRAEIIKYFKMDNPSIEIWYPSRHVGFSIYKVINGEWHRLKIIDGSQSATDIYDAKIIRYTLYDDRGIMFLGADVAYFLKSDEYYNDFDNFIKNINCLEHNRIRIYKTRTGTVVRCNDKVKAV